MMVGLARALLGRCSTCGARVRRVGLRREAPRCFACEPDGHPFWERLTRRDVSEEEVLQLWVVLECSAPELMAHVEAYLPLDDEAIAQRLHALRSCL